MNTIVEKISFVWRNKLDSKSQRQTLTHHTNHMLKINLIKRLTWEETDMHSNLVAESEWALQFLRRSVVLRQNGIYH